LGEEDVWDTTARLSREADVAVAVARGPVVWGVARQDYQRTTSGEMAPLWWSSSFLIVLLLLFYRIYI
jgi:hypothetical protein